MAKLRRISRDVVNKVLLDSKRRCCICYREGIFEPIEGDIAHLTAVEGPAHETADNLAYLCLDHHAALDAGRLSVDEVVAARRELYEFLEQEDREKETMLRPWQKYQKKVVGILHHEMFEEFGDGFSFNPAASLKGRSGLLREADLAINIRALSFELRILVEIKYSSRPLTVSDVEAVGTRFYDLEAAKGIIICNSGFTPEAIQRAESMGIGLRTIKADPEGPNAALPGKIAFAN
jgi:hypothetical protein